MPGLSILHFSDYFRRQIFEVYEHRLPQTLRMLAKCPLSLESLVLPQALQQLLLQHFPWQEFEKLLQCAKCKKAFYCSRECQTDAWKRHKLAGGIKALRNEPCRMH